MDVHTRKKLERKVKSNIIKIENSKDIIKKNQEYIIKFDEKASRDKISYSARNHYVKGIGMLSLFFKKDLKQITKPEMETFISKLSEGFEVNNTTFKTGVHKKEEYQTKFGPYKQSSENVYRAIIKKFYRWLLGDDEEDPNVTKWIKTRLKTNNRKLPEDMLKEEDVKKILGVITDLRDKAMLHILYDSGVRAGELLSLRIKNVHLDEYGAYIILSDSKTDVRRIRLISSVPDLELWVNHHPERDNPNQYLFISNHSKGIVPLGHAGLIRAMKKYVEKSGIKKNVYPHLFRHSRFTKLAGEFTSQQLKVMGGWRSTRMIDDVYVHLSGSDIDKAVLQKNGIIPKEEQENVLMFRTCPKCSERNPGDYKYCKKCHMVLDLHEAQSIMEKSKEKENELENLKSEMAGIKDMLKELWKDKKI